jgi:hypothetical protein
MWKEGLIVLPKTHQRFRKGGEPKAWEEVRKEVEE